MERTSNATRNMTAKVFSWQQHQLQTRHSQEASQFIFKSIKWIISERIYVFLSASVNLWPSSYWLHFTTLSFKLNIQMTNWVWKYICQVSSLTIKKTRFWRQWQMTTKRKQTPENTADNLFMLLKIQEFKIVSVFLENLKLLWICRLWVA